MPRRTFLTSVLVGAAFLGCGESAGPRLDGPSPTQQPRYLTWAGGAPLVIRAAGTSVATRGTDTGTRGGDLPEGFSASLQLSEYQVGFWAVKGQARGVQVDYQACVERDLEQCTVWAWRPYLLFDVPANALAQRPDGSAIPTGDSVFIALAIDPLNLVVDLEPSGLQFDAVDRAVLQMYYTGAQGDYDGDGDSDAVDSDIEQQWLGMFFQTTPTEPWVTMGSQHSLSGRWFTAWLEHFSGYAIAW
ncbi:MAG: hypothetical protein OER21_09365 [Gemmatimonadota bacterium]|nr:hypothetical protein [Gemmatimonadota bacterium]